MRSRRWLVLQAGLVAVACHLLAAPPENVTGDWDVKLRSSQGELRVKASFKQDGEKLTGAIRLPMGETALAGTLNETNITFGYTMTTNGRAVRIVMTRVLENDKINGTAEFGGGPRTEWSATRVMAPITQRTDPAGYVDRGQRDRPVGCDNQFTAGDAACKRDIQTRRRNNLGQPFAQRSANWLLMER
jgi:hypothetical protein